jgi:imidazolonepropionase-like amidohydrolase
MTRWRLPPTHLTDGDERDLWIEDGRFTSRPIDGAEHLPGRFVLPGLVDAHRHLSLYGLIDGQDPAPPRQETVIEALRADLGQGVLLVRDIGARKSVTLDVRPDASLPRLIAAGRWHAPEGRFFAPFHDPVPAQGLVDAALGEVARGATWIKIVADWSTAELSYDLDTLRAVVDAVHAAGARVATHSQWEGVRELVAIGVDSVEHGCRLDEPTLVAMARSGTAWTPTLNAFNEPMPDDLPAERRRLRLDNLDNYRAMLPLAARHGVTILAGTDNDGTVADEVGRLIEFGLEPVAALRAATTAARAFLGEPSLEDGARADVVTYEGDPRDDPAVLRSPAAIVLGGVRVS